MTICYSDPAKSLELSRARLTPEQWEKFEAHFEHCCAHSGLVRQHAGEHHDWMDEQFDWAKWFYLCGKGLL